MYLKTRGLVLRVTQYHDTDALLTLLTGEYGTITVKARGLRRRNSPLTGPCQLLAFNEFTLFENNGFYTIQDAHVVHMFHSLRSDLTKLALGTYLAQVAEVLSQEDMPNSGMLPLVLNCLYALSQWNEPELKVKTVFELRAACIGGYLPDLHGCCVCGQAYPDRFALSSGTLSCSHCESSSDFGVRIPLTPGMLDAMRYVVSCDHSKIFSFTIGHDTLEQLSYLTEGYLSTQMEQGFSSLDFYKSLYMIE